MLAIQGISKTYSNNIKALNEITLNIGQGIFGLLGPNGSGKSTLMRTIATLQSPDKGLITYEDTNILQNKTYLRNRLGYLPQEFNVYPRASAEELMNYLASLKGIKNGTARKQLVSDLLALVNLSNEKHRNVSSYSGGMKQRFGIAQALISNPSLIIVDEPTAGLDPEEKIRFLNIISEVGKEKTVILSTHIVEDITNLCKNFCIIQKGNIIVITNPKDALKDIENKIFLRKCTEHNFSGVLLTEKFISAQKYQLIFSENSHQQDFKPIPATLEAYYLLQMRKRPHQ